MQFAYVLTSTPLLQPIAPERMNSLDCPYCTATELYFPEVIHTQFPEVIPYTTTITVVQLLFYLCGKSWLQHGVLDLLDTEPVSTATFCSSLLIE